MAQVYLDGKALTLAGRELEPGDHAPNFTAVSPDLALTRLSDYKGRIKVITFFPSIDTAVCSDQVKEFNQRALSVSGEVTVIGISMDLPFAQKRFCAANRISSMSMLSDHRLASFGSSYGVLIEEHRLLARGVFIIDKNDVLRFAHLTGELNEPVDFKAAGAAMEEVAGTPAAPEPAFPWRCIPCQTESASLEPGKLDYLLARGRDWVRHDGRITKDFAFRDFGAASRFAGMITAVALEEGYQPQLFLEGNRLRVGLSTGGGVTENELIMSRIIDEIRY